MELNFIFEHTSSSRVSTSLEPRPNEENDVLVERARKKCADELIADGMGSCSSSDLCYLYSSNK